MKGIFVDGVPLDDILDRIHNKNARDEFLATTMEIKKSCYKPVTPSKPKTYVKHSKVRILTKEQIQKEYGIMEQTFRKEYGIMEKTFSTFHDHVLYLLETNGPLDIEELTKLTHRTKPVISATLSKVRLSAPENLKSDMRTKKWYIKDITAEKLSNFYRLKRNEDQRKSRERLNAMKEPPKRQTPPEKQTPQVQIPLPNAFNTIMQEIQNELKIKIQISGFLKVIFSLSK